MSDLIDELLSSTKKCYAVVMFALAIIFAALIWWFFRGYGGNSMVSKKVAEIRTSAEINERHADFIVDAAKQKEEEVKRDVAEKMVALSDDALPDLLAGLLSEYRKQSGR